MKRIFIIMASFILILFSGCGEDSSGDAIFLNSKKESHEGSSDERCLEKYDVEGDVWSISPSEDSYIKTQICDYAVAFFGIYDVEMTCTSVRYDSGLDHFVVTLKEDDHEWDFGIEISECNFKLTTDGVYSSVIAGMGYWTMDRCLCKEEDGDVYYRVGKSDAESSSSSKKSDDKKNSSSSGKKQSSSSKQVVVASIEDYEFVEINSQYWMKRDLDVFVEGSRCYNDDPANCEKYGRLYTWAQAMGINEKYNSEELGEISLPYQGICPEGTHLPSYGEWEDLFDFVNDHSEYKSYFMNQMGGAYDYQGYYRSLEEESLFWSSTEYTNSGYYNEFAWLWYFHADKVGGADNGHKITGAYVRCIKNDAP